MARTGVGRKTGRSRGVTLLCLSSWSGDDRYGGQLSIDVTRGIAFQASADLAVGETFGASAFDVVASARVVGHASERCDVESAIESAVTAPVEPVTGRVP